MIMIRTSYKFKKIKNESFGILTRAHAKSTDRRYETMLVMRPNMFDEENDRQLAKFESFLRDKNAKNIQYIVKGKQKMSYPIAGYWEGIYAIFQFTADSEVASSVNATLSNPDVESQGNIIR